MHISIGIFQTHHFQNTSTEIENASLISSKGILSEINNIIKLTLIN
jgi:hypothetical protein